MRLPRIAAFLVIIMLGVLVSRPSALAREEVLYDQNLNMRAGVISIPNKWDFKYNLITTGPGTTNLAWTATNKRLGAWVQQFFAYNFSHIDIEGSAPPYLYQALAQTKLTPPMPAYQVLQEIVNTFQGENIEVEESNEMPALKAELQKTAAMLSSQSGTKTDVDVYYAVLTYDRGGKRMREVVRVVTFYLYQSMNFFPTRLQMCNWFAIVHSIGMPDGLQDDQGLIQDVQAIMNGVIDDPQWVAVKAQQQRRHFDQEAQHQRDMSDIITNTQREISDSQLQAFNNRMESQSRVMEGWGDVFTQRDRVVNPITGGEMKIDNRPKHSWIDQGNNILYSDQQFDPNNPLFNPGGTYRQIR